MPADATCVDIGAKDLDRIVAFATSHAIDFAVVAPDDPLVLGAVDRLEAVGIACFGPRKNAAILEGSKIFSKNLMKKYGIPTAAYEVFSDADAALAYLENAPIPTDHQCRWSGAWKGRYHRADPRGGQTGRPLHDGRTGLWRERRQPCH